jgi:hypothetical protein
MEKLLACLFALMIITGISFGITYGFVYLICWCFNLTFSFKTTLGIWLIIGLIGFALPRGR